MKLLKIFPLVAVCLTAPAYAQSMFDKLDVDDLSPTMLVISDGATGGCWTNAGEAESYAEDQLGLSGVEVVQDDVSPINTIFSINVRAERTQAGDCVGSIQLLFNGPVEFQGKEVFASLLMQTRYFQTQTNANIIVLDGIKESLSKEPFERR
jgi:hypothetical protein